MPDAIQLRGAASGPMLAGTPGYLLAFNADGRTVSPVPPPVTPIAAGVYINVKDPPAPLMALKGDGTDDEIATEAIFEYAAAIAPSTGGVCLFFPAGIYGFTSPKYVQQNVSLLGTGAGSVLDLLPLTTLARNASDCIVVPGPLNGSVATDIQIQNLRLLNETNMPGRQRVWAPSTHYNQGETINTKQASNIMLRCVTAGTSAPHSPIGELTPAFASAKLIGVANGPCQPLFNVVQSGYLGALKVAISTDAGATFGPTLDTTAADFNDFILPGFGGTFGIRIGNAPWVVSEAITVAADFVVPAVNATVGVTLSTVGRIAHFNYILLGGQLMLVTAITGPTTCTLYNVGASSAVVGSTVHAGAAVNDGIYVPLPRIEVIGNTPADDYVVDVTAQFGPLGSAACTFIPGYRANAEKWKYGLTVNNGGSQTTTGGAAFYDYAIPTTSLTLRLHTGIYQGISDWNYLTPGFGWSLQAGTQITDGTAVWQVLPGTSALRLNTAARLGVQNCWLQGGNENLAISQAETLQIGGNMLFSDSSMAGFSVSNGPSSGRLGETQQFANAITWEGTGAIYTDGWGLIHEGGSGFSLNGSQTFQLCPRGWCFLGGLIGADMNVDYIETTGGISRNSAYASRVPCGSFLGMSFGAGYWGSAAGISALDFYQGNGVAFTGIPLSGTTAGLTGVAGLNNFTIQSCVHIAGGANKVIDALPLTGRVNCAGASTSLYFPINGNNFAPGPVFSPLPTLKGRFRVSAYVSINTPGTAGPLNVVIGFTDDSGVARSVTIATLANVAVAGGIGGELIVETDGVNPLTYSVAGIVTPGALSYSLAIAANPELG